MELKIYIKDIRRFYSFYFSLIKSKCERNSFVIFQVQILMFFISKTIELQNSFGEMNVWDTFELGVNDKLSDRDKYNTEIDSSND